LAVNEFKFHEMARLPRFLHSVNAEYPDLHLMRPNVKNHRPALLFAQVRCIAGLAGA